MYLHLLYLLICTYTTQAASLNEKPFNEEHHAATLITRLNLGVLFDAHSVLDNSNAYWHHLLQIRKLSIPILPLQITNPCKQDKISQFLTSSLKICDLYDTLFNNYERQASLLQKDIRLSIETAHTLLNNYKLETDSKTRRGILNVIGDAFKYLFGTATTRDLHKTTSIAKRIDTQVRTMGHNLNTFKDQTAAEFDFQLKQNKNLVDRLKIIYNRTTVLQQEITTLTQTFQRTMTDFTNTMFTYNKFLITYVSLINQRIAALTLLQAQALEYLHDIEQLITGKISPRMIPLTQIQEIFTMITKRLTDDRSSFFITDPDPTHFYSAPNFLFYASEEHIYLHLRIPLSAYQATFEVYKIITIPLPIHNNQTSNEYTLYRLPQYLAIATTKTYYIELSQNEYDLCTGFPIKHCKHNLPIKPTTQLSCALAIFNDLTNKVPKLCDSTLIVDNTITQRFIPLQDNTYFVTGPVDNAPWILSCDTHYPPPMNPCTLCVITIPCKCLLTTKSYILPKTQLTCDKSDDSSYTLVQQYHMNFNFLSNWFYNVSIIESLTAHSYLDYRPTIQLPKIITTLPEIASKTVLEQDRIDIDMKRLATKIRNNKFDDNTDTQTQYSYIHDITFTKGRPLTTIITYTFYALNILCIIFIVLLFIRMQHLTRLMMTLTLTTSAIPRVNTFTLNHDLPQTETISVNYIQLPATAIYYAATAIAIVSILLILSSFRQCIKRIIKWQTYMHLDPATHTEILLEFTTHTQTIALHILTIPTHYSLVTLENCSVTLYNLIQNCCTAYIRINWDATTLAVKGKFNNIRLPDVIPIPITLIGTTKQIIYDANLHMTIWIGMQGRYHIVPINNENRLLLTNTTGEHSCEPQLVQSCG